MPFSSGKEKNQYSERGDSSLQTYSFVTFFDSGYLSRGLALIESIRRHENTSSILIVCIDELTFNILSKKSDELNLACIMLEDLIRAFPELAMAKSNRSAVEFYFTLTPFVLRFALLGKPKNHIAIYLDADLYFFQNPLLVVKSLGNSSVGIIEHNYPWFLKSLESKYGTYNVGLLAFKNNKDGNSVLEWWALKCIEWCRDYPEKGKYADQGYLDNFANLTKELRILTNPGFNLAPWNSASSKLKLYSNHLTVNNNELTFFHFHGLKNVGSLWISSQLNYYSPMPRKIFFAIYGNYVQHLSKIECQFDVDSTATNLVLRKGFGLRGLISNTARTFFRALSIVFGQAIRYKRKVGCVD
jgi:hypothetical protein